MIDQVGSWIGLRLVPVGVADYGEEFAVQADVSLVLRRRTIRVADAGDDDVAYVEGHEDETVVFSASPEVLDATIENLMEARACMTRMKRNLERRGVRVVNGDDESPDEEGWDA